MPRETLMLMFVALLIATVVVLVVLFFLLFFKNKANKNIYLLDLNTAQKLDTVERGYFSLIRYDSSKRQIIVVRNSDIRKCVLALVYYHNGKTLFQRYKVNFNGDQAIAINVSFELESYKVLLESVDGNIVKNERVSALLSSSIIVSVVPAILYAGALIMYAMMAATYLKDYWADFVSYYLLSALALIFPVLTIGGYLLSEFLSKKGVF